MIAGQAIVWAVQKLSSHCFCDLLSVLLSAVATPRRFKGCTSRTMLGEMDRGLPLRERG